MRPAIRPSSPHGFVLIDAIAGLLLLGVIAGLLYGSLNRTSRARDRLAAERAAAGRLERALVDLSLARPLDPTVRVAPLPTTRPGGLRWVQLSTDVAPGQPLTLIGATPSEGGRP